MLGTLVNFGDFRYETLVTNFEPTWKPGGLNLRFRASNDGSRFYVCGTHSPRGYHFMIVDRTVSPESWTPIAWEDMSPIDSGLATRKIAVEARGDTFKVWVNDVLVDTITDSTYSSGEIGLGFPGNAHVAFDYVRVWALPQ